MRKDWDEDLDTIAIELMESEGCDTWDDLVDDSNDEEEVEEN